MECFFHRELLQEPPGQLNNTKLSGCSNIRRPQSTKQKIVFKESAPPSLLILMGPFARTLVSSSILCQSGQALHSKALPLGAPGAHALLNDFGINFLFATLTLTLLIVYGIKLKSVIGHFVGTNFVECNNRSALLRLHLHS